MIKVLFVALFAAFCSCNNLKPEQSQVVSQKDSIQIAQLYAIATELQYANLDSALKIYKQIEILSRNSKSDKLLVDYYKAMSALYGIRLKNIPNSKKYVDSCWYLANKKGNEHLKYKAFFVEGRYHLANDHTPQAIKSFLQSIETQTKPMDSLTLLVTYSDLAKIYFYQQNVEKAIAYYKPLLEYDERMKDTASSINNYLNYYSYKSHSAKPENAIDYLYKAKMLTSNTKYKSLNHLLLFNFSVYYAKIKNLDSALMYINEAIKEQEHKQVSPENYFKFYILKCQLHTEKKEFELANKALLESTRKMTADQIELNYRSVYYSTLYLLKKAENKFEEALTALEKQNEIQVEIDKNIKDEQLLNHEKELKRLSAAQTIGAKNNIITRQQLYTIMLLITCLLLSALGILFYQHSRKVRKIETLKWIQKEKEQELENEKRLIQNQLDERNRIAQDMHDDLGSTITTIAMAAELFHLHPEDAVTIQIIKDSTHDLSIKINEIVWSLNVQNDTLLSLIAYFRKFARNFLSDAGIKLIWQECEQLEEQTILGYKRRSIYLTLKEILNNIVRHSNATEVVIIIKRENQLLKLTIKDNGVGLTEHNEGAYVRQGNGLTNIKSRMKNLGGEAHFKSDSGTVVILNIPL